MILCREMELLQIPKNRGTLPLIQWPLFLLASKIFLAKDIGQEIRESKESQEELWDRISRDDYMKYAVQECFYNIKFILLEMLDDEGNNEGKKWVERIYDDIQGSIANRSTHVDLQLNKLPLVIQKVTALLGILFQGQISLLCGAVLSFGLTRYSMSEFELLAEELLMSDYVIRVSDSYFNLLSEFELLAEELLMSDSGIRISDSYFNLLKIAR